MAPKETTILPCPFCGSHDSVMTHAYRVDDCRRRRRVCNNCGLPFYTREVIERDSLPSQNEDTNKSPPKIC